MAPRSSSIALLALLCLGLSDCLPASGPSPAAFTQPLTADLRALDPAVAYDQASWEIIPNLYETLFQYAYLQDPYQVEPLLAADRPEVSADGLTVTIRIQQGVRFHPDPAFGADAEKGRELVAADFVYSLKRLALPQLHSPGWALLEGRIEGLDAFRERAARAPNPAAAVDAPVAGLSAPDRYTLRIRLTRPFPRLLQILALPFTAAVPREVVDRYADGIGILRDKAVGTGPFVLASRVPGSRTVLRRNSGYRPSFYPTDSHPRFVKPGLTADAGKPIPFLDTLTFVVESEEKNLWEGFLSGRFDIYSPPPERLAALLNPDLSLRAEHAKRGLRAEIETAASTFVVLFNLEDETLGKNKLLRQAIASAIPREDYIARFTGGTGLKALTSVPPGVPGRPSQPAVKYDYGLERAKALLEEAGYPGGDNLPLLRLDLRGSGEEDRRMGDFFRESLAAAGIRLQVVYNSFPGYLEKLRRGNFQISVSRWTLDYPDAENVFQMVYGPNRRNGINLARMAHAGLDEAFEKLTRTEAAIERAALVTRIEEILQEELPWIPIHHSTQVRLYQPWVANFRGNPMLLTRHKHYRIDGTVRARYVDLRE